ncbi:hypothetical protein V1477_014210 [Vespula maculifrons]|uniref:Uncharacterized protein n=1 Tax=Vespula maculifrons TaxID=7453 RepID=A0ABD2BKD8_VESMC
MRAAPLPAVTLLMSVFGSTNLKFTNVKSTNLSCKTMNSIISLKFLEKNKILNERMKCRDIRIVKCVFDKTKLNGFTAIIDKTRIYHVPHVFTRCNENIYASKD